jgi:hypothetical protein
MIAIHRSIFYSWSTESQSGRMSMKFRKAVASGKEKKNDTKGILFSFI